MSSKSDKDKKGKNKCIVLDSKCFDCHRILQGSEICNCQDKGSGKNKDSGTGSSQDDKSKELAIQQRNRLQKFFGPGIKVDDDYDSSGNYKYKSIFDPGIKVDDDYDSSGNYKYKSKSKSKSDSDDSDDNDKAKIQDKSKDKSKSIEARTEYLHDHLDLSLIHI